MWSPKCRKVAVYTVQALKSQLPVKQYYVSDQFFLSKINIILYFLQFLQFLL